MPRVHDTRAGSTQRVSASRRTYAIRCADCSDLTIVPTWTWTGLPGKGSAVSGTEQSRPINEGHEGVARLVAASPRSTGREHAWVNLDIGIAHVLVEPTAK
jgi:hypothetical protein